MTTEVQSTSTTRRFHDADAPYTFPNDEVEWERLDAQHFAIKDYWKGNNAGTHFGNPKKILELGAGSGVWAMETALEYPDAEVVACDISDFHSSRKPVNCTFLQVNLAKEWPFESNSYDVVHGRMICVHLPHFEKFIQKAIEATSPGGIILLQDFDSEYHSISGPVPEALKTATVVYDRFLTSVGGDAFPGPKLEQILRASGTLSEVHSEIVHMPMTPWTDDPELNAMGTAMRESIIAAAEGSGEGLIKAGMTDEVKADLAKELRDEKNKVFFDVYFVWGRKKE